jgi:hypothetical protein
VHHEFVHLFAAIIHNCLAGVTFEANSLRFCLEQQTSRRALERISVAQAHDLSALSSRVADILASSRDPQSQTRCSRASALGLHGEKTVYLCPSDDGMDGYNAVWAERKPIACVVG